MSFPNVNHRNVNVRCGSHPIKGWINYDYNIFIFFARIGIVRFIINRLRFVPSSYKEFMKIVIRENIKFANLGKYIPENDSSINILYSSHLLEHLDKEETYQFLKEVRRILVIRGIIRVVVPDFDKFINEYSESNNPDKFIDDSCLVGEKPKTLLKKNSVFDSGLWLAF